MKNIVPSARDVVEAAQRLSGWIVQTPLLESTALNEQLGARLLVKPECLQAGGSFKIRGALNRLLSLSADERAGGVVAFSSGNHAQAVALAAKWLGVTAAIVMPRDAPEVKRRRTAALGAEVVLYDRYREDREAIAAALADERGAALVPPFDHPEVVAGQGSVGLEVAAAALARKLDLGAFYAPCSGGGLIAGSALPLGVSFPECRIYAVEPAGYEDMRASLAAGRRQQVDAGGPTLCDALMAPMPGAIPFKICRDAGVRALAVTDDDVLRAMAVAAREFRLVVEPSGAAALAAALADAERGSRPVVAVVSGGNVDASLYSRAVSQYME